MSATDFDQDDPAAVLRHAAEALWQVAKSPNGPAMQALRAEYLDGTIADRVIYDLGFKLRDAAERVNSSPRNDVVTTSSEQQRTAVNGKGPVTPEK